MEQLGSRMVSLHNGAFIFNISIYNVEEICYIYIYYASII